MKLRRRLVGRLLRLAERLDAGCAVRWMASFSYTFEAGEGIRLRTDGRGCQLWYVAAEQDRAWTEADTDWDGTVDQMLGRTPCAMAEMLER